MNIRPMKHLIPSVILSSIFIGALVFRSDNAATRAVHPPALNNTAAVSNASFLKALSQIRFVENRGQLPKDALYSAPLARGRVLFYRDKIEFHILSERLREKKDLPEPTYAGFASRKRNYSKEREVPEAHTFSVRYPGSNANENPFAAGLREEKVNYFIGNNDDKWRRNVPAFDTLIYRDIYEGIDLLFYDGGGKLKYDFVVKPGASHEKIAMEYEGIDSLSITASGDLSFRIGGDIHIEEQPYVYQTASEMKIVRSASFRHISENAVGYLIRNVDASLPLVIDPVYSTMLGGGGPDGVAGIRYVNDSVCVVRLSTSSSDLITDTNSFQRTMHGSGDIYLVSINTSSGKILFSTYYGGNRDESGVLTYDYGAHLLIIGVTNSSDLPSTNNAFQKSFRGDRDCFIAMFDSACSNLLFSSYFGGSGLDVVEDACLDSTGILHMTGWTDSYNSFPRTSGAVQIVYAGGGDDAFYAKVSIENPKILYSTFLGGCGYDEARGICLDSHGNAIICGYTTSTDYPVRGNALQPTLPCIESGFITKIDSSGRRIDYSSFFGGSMNTFLESVAATNDGDFVFLGQTYARDIATTPGVFQPKQGNADTNYFRFDLTLLRLDSAFNVKWCSYLGGTRSEDAVAVRMIGDDIAVASYSISTDYPAVNALKSGTLFVENAAFSLVNGSGTRLIFSTLWGGSSYEYVNIMYTRGRKAYVGGFTGSEDYPTSENAIKKTKTGQTDGFLLILDMDELVVSAEKEREVLPSYLVVSQNYPNPFTRSGTAIPYTARQRGTVEITVYDTQGRIIEHVKQDVSPGGHVHNFNHPSLPPGVYFCRAAMNGQAVIKKMIKLE